MNRTDQIGGRVEHFRFPELRAHLFVASIAAVLALGISFFLPKIYQAKAEILLTGNSGKAGGMLADLASSAGLGEALSGRIGGSENPAVAYPKILLSKPVLDHTLGRRFPPGSLVRPQRVIDMLDLKEKSDRALWDEALTAMRKSIKVSTDPIAGVIAVTVDARDSVLAAFVANTLLEELDKFNIDSRRSRGKALREFVEVRLEESRQELGAAEANLEAFKTANLRIGNSPALTLKQVRLERELQFRASVHELLARQYELSRIEEQRDTPTFSVIEPATPPLRKHSPNPILNGVLAFSAVLTLLLLFEYLDRLGLVPTPLSVPAGRLLHGHKPE